nr:hypothetical protein [Tanacetum cinerariifolium]
MGFKGIAKVDRGCVLRCDFILDFREGREEGEQCRTTVHRQWEKLGLPRWILDVFSGVTLLWTVAPARKKVNSGRDTVHLGGKQV